MEKIKTDTLIQISTYNPFMYNFIFFFAIKIYMNYWAKEI